MYAGHGFIEFSILTFLAKYRPIMKPLNKDVAYSRSFRELMWISKKLSALFHHRCDDLSSGFPSLTFVLPTIFFVHSLYLQSANQERKTSFYCQNNRALFNKNSCKNVSLIVFLSELKKFLQTMR